MTDQETSIYDVPDSEEERNSQHAKEISKREHKLQRGRGREWEHRRALEQAPEQSGKADQKPSQQQHGPITTKRKIVSLLSDDEDDSDDERDKDDEGDSRAKKPEQLQETPKKPRGAMTPIVGTIHRKELEEARLKRLEAKRKAEGRSDLSAVPPNSFYGPGNTVGGAANSETYASRFRAVPATNPSKAMQKVAHVNLQPSTPRQDSIAHLPTPIATQQATPTNHAWYPKGITKKTFLENRCNSPNTIRIQDVLQKETLVTTLLSAFEWDYSWIMGLLPLHRKDHNMVFVMQGKEPADRQLAESIFGGLPRIELVFPPMEGQVRIMHSKLMLLFHKEGEREWLRIAVPTANLTDYDWGLMTGVMENMVFLIDLPKLDEPNPSQTFFLEELIHFCSEQTIPDKIINSLVYYDFLETKQMAFVHSIGGSHVRENLKRTGYCGLGTAIKRLGYNSGIGLEVDYVTSSLGAMKQDFVSNMYRAAQGHNGLAEFERRQKKPIKAATQRKGKALGPFRQMRAAAAVSVEEITDDDSDFEEETKWENISGNFRVFFPSKETVRTSKGGFPCGGTVCFWSKWWKDPAFPKVLVKDCKSVRSETLMHNKVLFARPAKSLKSKNGKMAAWAYVGSANLSESAWGKLVLDRSTKSPKLNCMNWECGVIIPVPAKSMGRKLSGKEVEQDGPIDIHTFEDVVPVPMETPGALMKEPWFFNEQ